METVGGIDVKCHSCGKYGVENVHRYVWYVNAYGARIRVFCHACGDVYDIRQTKYVLTVDKLSMKAILNHERTSR